MRSLLAKIILLVISIPMSGCAIRKTVSEYPFVERIHTVVWQGERCDLNFKGIQKISEKELGVTTERINGLAFHPDGKITFSSGYGSTPNMTMAYWGLKDIGETVVNLQYVPHSEKDDVNKTEEKGYFGFFAGPLAFDSGGTCHFSLGSLGPNGLYKVVSNSPVKIEKLYSLDSTRSLQIPLFDTEYLYSTSWNGIFRYPIVPSQAKPVKPWFSIQGDNILLGDCLVINQSQVIAEVIFKVPKETSGKGYYIKSFLFDGKRNCYKVISVDEIGPMAISWDGQRMVRFDKTERSINEFFLK
ncbi:MAG: hypothetical protein H8E62_06145 [Planctomycetes bacterium]|nr:hypothetical protein [Planctomycetota bacterium]